MGPAPNPKWHHIDDVTVRRKMLPRVKGKNLPGRQQERKVSRKQPPLKMKEIRLINVFSLKWLYKAKKIQQSNSLPLAPSPFAHFSSLLSAMNSPQNPSFLNHHHFQDSSSSFMDFFDFSGYPPPDFIVEEAETMTLPEARIGRRSIPMTTEATFTDNNTMQVKLKIIALSCI